MSRPLNFLHLTTFFPPYHFGGDAMYIYRLSHALGDLGHHVEVVHCKDAYHLLHPAEPEMQFSEHPNVTVHRMKSGVGWLSPLLTQQTGRPFFKRNAIERVLSKRNFDVIHYHNISLLGPQVLTLEGRGPSIKLYTTHEHWLICPMHVLWKFNKRVCEQPDCIRCTLLGKRPPQIWRYTGLLQRTSRHVDQFLSPSRFTARMHGERGFPQPVDHLPYFIEKVDADWQTPGPRPQEKPYFLFVGRLEIIKGLHTLIKIWERVQDIDLLIAGTGNYMPQLKTQSASNPRIKFLGARTQKELGALYHHALACIVPSITYETFGMIIIEAFARKTPVIARDLGALTEVVQDSGGGFIYETEDELLSAIRRIASSPPFRTELGENGYSAFVRWWSREAHIEMYFERLRKIALEKFQAVPWESGSETETERAPSAVRGSDP